MNLPDAPIAHEGFFATHFFTVSDQDKSKDFYVRILGGRVIKPDNPCYIKLANTWIILNSGGGPTPDKPEVVLETPLDLNRVNGFLNLRVADIWACYKQWSDKGAFFLTEPLDNHGWEWRCYMRDPDGYLIEVGQYTQMALDRFKSDASEAPRIGMALPRAALTMDWDFSTRRRRWPDQYSSTAGQRNSVAQNISSLLDCVSTNLYLLWCDPSSCLDRLLGSAR
jgi:catechol 2,3-dioxygenase-like lactoylglutathione lyase family enzyme